MRPNKWKDIPCSQIERLFNIPKMAILPEVICRFTAIPIPTKIPMVFLQKWKSQSLNWYGIVKWPQKIKTRLKNKNQVQRHTLPDFKTYYKAPAIKTVWYRNKDRHIHQWKKKLKVQKKKKTPYIYGQLLFDKGVRQLNKEGIVS